MTSCAGVSLIQSKLSRLFSMLRSSMHRVVVDIEQEEQTVEFLASTLTNLTMISQKLRQKATHTVNNSLNAYHPDTPEWMAATGRKHSPTITSHPSRANPSAYNSLHSTFGFLLGQGTDRKGKNDDRQKQKIEGGKRGNVTDRVFASMIERPEHGESADKLKNITAGMPKHGIVSRLTINYKFCQSQKLAGNPSLQVHTNGPLPPDPRNKRLLFPSTKLASRPEPSQPPVTRRSISTQSDKSVQIHGPATNQPRRASIQRDSLKESSLSAYSQNFKASAGEDSARFTDPLDHIGVIPKDEQLVRKHMLKLSSPLDPRDSVSRYSFIPKFDSHREDRSTVGGMIVDGRQMFAATGEIPMLGYNNQRQQTILGKEIPSASIPSSALPDGRRVDMHPSNFSISFKNLDSGDPYNPHSHRTTDLAKLSNINEIINEKGDAALNVIKIPSRHGSRAISLFDNPSIKDLFQAMDKDNHQQKFVVPGSNKSSIDRPKLLPPSKLPVSAVHPPTAYRLSLDSRPSPKHVQDKSSLGSSGILEDNAPRINHVATGQPKVKAEVRKITHKPRVGRTSAAMDITHKDTSTGNNSRGKVDFFAHLRQKTASPRGELSSISNLGSKGNNTLQIATQQLGRLKALNKSPFYPQTARHNRQAPFSP